MNNLLQEEINEGWLLVYMDDILIFTPDKKKLDIYTCHVLAKLQENNLFLNLDKCAFSIKEVDYL